MTFDGNSQTMELVEPNIFYRPGLSISQDNGFADKLDLRLFKFGKDSGRASFGGWHGWFEKQVVPIGIANESV
jgi:hypothetical protein